MGEDLYQFEKGGTSHDADLIKWLQTLPKPIAILACNDIRGQQIVNACREIDIKVPEEVAVLGVDNDSIICRLCRPTLSSIEPDVEQIGFLAGKLIAAQLSGKPVVPRHLVAPRQVVQRQSTDSVGVNHPLVIQASRIIRDQNYKTASVEQICQVAGVSRSTLDHLFLVHLGRTVADEITRVHLERSKNLLRNSALPLSEIAEHCGFSSASYFCRFFKRGTGQTPDAYRKQ